MTDLENFIQMVKAANIVYDISKNEDNPYLDRTTLTFHYGYAGFVSVITFDRDGKLVSIEAYE